jgi:hypothetical protein
MASVQPGRRIRRLDVERKSSIWLAALLLIPGSQAWCMDADQAERLAESLRLSREYQTARADRADEELRKENERRLSSPASLPITAKWRPATKEELAMKSDPGAPGAAAIFLYTESRRDDVQRRELIYRQIKILTEEGRDLANISINYDRKRAPISRIEARVIQPDGKIVPFKGKVYDRPLASNREMSWRVKSLALPAVRVGSIIEYRFWRELPTSEPVRWMLNQELFTRHARFSLRSGPGGFPRWSFSRALPAGTEAPRRDADGTVHMEAHNIAPLVIEDYMPPPQDLVLSVNFTYFSGDLAALMPPAMFWRAFGEAQWQSIEAFLGDSAQAAQRVHGIVASEDGAGQKVRKLYEHVRGLGNVDIPESMDDKAEKKCSRNRQTVLEVGVDGCGTTAQLQLYFLALVRAAGVPAAPVLAASRAERFFSPDSKEPSRIDDLLIAATIDGQDVLLNPAVPFLPYGSLFWFETGVPGLKLSDSGGEWFTTPMPGPADAVTRRTARLVLTEDGALEGTVTVRHSGHEATSRMMQLFLADEPTRLSALEQDLRRVLAVPADIAVERQPDWRGSNGTLEIEYRVKVRDWVLSSGDRLMVGVGLFGGEQKGKFIPATREQPIYFEFPFTTEDEIEIVLPAGLKLQSAPARQVSPDAALKYTTRVEPGEGSVSIHRSLAHNLMLALQSQYPRVKGFYELVRSGDQDQVILAK